jgi:hypothetical protein
MLCCAVPCQAAEMMSTILIIYSDAVFAAAAAAAITK